MDGPVNGCPGSISRKTGIPAMKEVRQLVIVKFQAKRKLVRSVLSDALFLGNYLGLVHIIEFNDLCNGDLMHL